MVVGSLTTRCLHTQTKKVSRYTYIARDSACVRVPCVGVHFVFCFVLCVYTVGAHISVCVCVCVYVCVCVCVCVCGCGQRYTIYGVAQKY